MRIFSALAVFLVLMNAGKIFPAVNAAHASEMRDFNQYLQLLLEKDPDLKSLEYMLESKKFVPDWAYSLPDPTLNFGLANVPSGSFALDRENMTQKQIGVAQFFPAPGKRKKLRSVAEDDIDIAAAMVPERRLELIKMARVLSYRLKYLQKAKLIVLKNEETLRGFIRIALTKYEVGLGLQTDVLLAQVELSKMSDLLMRIEQKIRSTGDMLATMADLPIDTDWTSYQIAPLPPMTGGTDKLLEEALVKRPIFKKLEAEIKKAENTADLAWLDLLPDYTVGVTYGQRDNGPVPGGQSGVRDDMISASVTLSIPFWYKQRQKKKIAETLELVNRAKHDFTSESWRVRYRIADLLAVEKKNMDLMVLYETGLLPQASQTVEASLAAYQVNKVDFLTLVTNQIALYNFEIVRDKIEFELQAARARMQRALGEFGTEVSTNGR